MVYGETGRYPLEICVKVRILNFWSKLLLNSSKLSSILYQLLYNLHNTGICTSKWLMHVKTILDSIGLSYIWDSQHTLKIADVKYFIKQILCDQFIQKWYSEIEKSSRGQLFYSLFKNDFGLEKYLIKLSKENRLYITKLRCSNIKFPIETGRWSNTPREDRLCNLCNTGAIGNEFHYIFICSYREIFNLRAKYIPNYYVSNPREDKLKGMLMYCNVTVLNNLAIFLKKITKYLD